MLMLSTLILLKWMYGQNLNKMKINAHIRELVALKSISLVIRRGRLRLLDMFNGRMMPIWSNVA